MDRKDIIINLLVDNGNIILDAMFSNNLLVSVNCMNDCMDIFNHCKMVFNDCSSIINTDNIELRLSNLLSEIATYRKDYAVGSDDYIVLNSLFDKTCETFTNFIKTV